MQFKPLRRFPITRTLMPIVIAASVAMSTSQGVLVRYFERRNIAPPQATPGHLAAAQDLQDRFGNTPLASAHPMVYAVDGDEVATLAIEFPDGSAMTESEVEALHFTGTIRSHSAAWKPINRRYPLVDVYHFARQHGFSYVVYHCGGRQAMTFPISGGVR